MVEDQHGEDLGGRKDHPVIHSSDGGAMVGIFTAQAVKMEMVRDEARVP